MTRSVLMLIGPLIHEYSEFKIPYAGGCKLGTRTVEPHLYALEEFGVNIVAHNGRSNITVKAQKPERVTLFEQSDTVTENVLMAAAIGDGETIIDFGSSNYAVQDVCLYLQALGVKIEGIGTTTFKVKGASKIKKNLTFSHTEDPIEAMFFTAAAITTNSKILIRRVPIEFMSVELVTLKKMGLKFKESKRYKAENGFTDLVDLTILKHNGELVAIGDKIHAKPYPGLNADNLPLLFRLLVAQGVGP